MFAGPRTTTATLSTLLVTRLDLATTLVPVISAGQVTVTPADDGPDPSCKYGRRVLKKPRLKTKQASKRPAGLRRRAASGRLIFFLVVLFCVFCTKTAGQVKKTAFQVVETACLL